MRPAETLGLLADWTRRDFRVRISQTVLGAAWAVIQPIALTAALVFVFRAVAQFEAGVPYATYVFSGMLVWQIFATGLYQAANAMASSMYIASKAVYPRIVAPVSAVLLSLVDFTMGLVLFPILAVIQSAPIRLHPVPLVLSVAGCLAFTIGLGSLASALSIFVRDVRSLLPLALQVTLLVTPVAYPPEKVPAAIRDVTGWNPMTTYVAGFRSGLLRLPGPDLGDWLRAGGVTAVVLVLGVWYFHAVERRFADVA